MFPAVAQRQLGLLESGPENIKRICMAIYFSPPVTRSPLLIDDRAAIFPTLESTLALRAGKIAIISISFQLHNRIEP